MTSFDMCNRPVWTKEDEKYAIAPSFRKFLVRFSVKFYQTLPDDVLKFSVDYFEDLKNQQNLQLAREGKGFAHATNVRRAPVFNESIKEDDESEIINFAKYEKTPEEKLKLMKALNKIVFFQQLDKRDIEQLVNAMLPKNVEAGKCIICQGEIGDYFFIVDSGEYKAYVKNKDGVAELVKTYKNEGSFGELALLYDLPRSATVKCTSSGKLWAIARNHFRQIIATNAMKKRKRYVELIASVPLLSDLSPDERLNLADALQKKSFKKNDCIIKQNDYPDGMYFIESGVVKVIVTNSKKQNVEVCKLGRGDYFGELALINHQRRSASVYAVEPVTTVFLETEVFERLLGPCLDIMKRNKRNYEERLKKLENESTMPSTSVNCA
ncbi:cAMP-dependent protein kinase type II regulatory subunit-like [Cimex lectularius]|uniref:Cyclic nucleotide-binding domain-containing protein n=1 Tax=Cimex lectularius TaxID=79782 RepID=A0A8I6SAK3_CIMLE|nr:cAMP-dependent protein kinase type II regulatory subunit-like [Cimex lectularius]